MSCQHTAILSLFMPKLKIDIKISSGLGVYKPVLERSLQVLLDLFGVNSFVAARLKGPQLSLNFQCL